METQQPQLSEEARKRLEEIVLAAFHNLLIDTTNQVSRIVASATSVVAQGIQSQQD